MFLAYASQLSNHRLYVLCQNLLWKIDVRNKTSLQKPEDIRYLPRELPRYSTRHSTEFTSR